MANAYAAALAEQMALERQAQEQATARSVAEYKRQQDLAQAQADRYLQAADVQRQFSRRDAEQVLAAQGKTGGLSESSLLRNQSIYENTANDIRNNLDTTLNSLNSQIQQEKDAGNIAMRKIASQYAAALASIADSGSGSGSGNGGSGGSGYIETPGGNDNVNSNQPVNPKSTYPSFYSLTPTQRMTNLMNWGSGNTGNSNNTNASKVAGTSTNKNNEWNAFTTLLSLNSARK